MPYLRMGRPEAQVEEFGRREPPRASLNLAEQGWKRPLAWMFR
jgi:hypothetical protein